MFGQGRSLRLLTLARRFIVFIRENPDSIYCLDHHGLSRMHKPKNFGGCVVMLSKGKSLLKRSLRWQVVAGLVCLLLVPLLIVATGCGGGGGGPT
jgi:hypothetical protein